MSDGDDVMWVDAEVPLEVAFDTLKGRGVVSEFEALGDARDESGGVEVVRARADFAHTLAEPAAQLR